MSSFSRFEAKCRWLGTFPFLRTMREGWRGKQCVWNSETIVAGFIAGDVDTGLNQTKRVDVGESMLHISFLFMKAFQSNLILPSARLHVLPQLLKERNASSREDVHFQAVWLLIMDTKPRTQSWSGQREVGAGQAGRTESKSWDRLRRLTLPVEPSGNSSGSLR